MLTRTEAERLAAACHALRADWPIDSLMKFLEQRRHRPLIELGVELTWVALDPETKTPGRIDEDGPWKHHVRAVQPVNMTDLLPTRSHDDCKQCNQPATHPSHFNETDTGCVYVSPAAWAAGRAVDHHAKAAQIRELLVKDGDTHP